LDIERPGKESMLLEVRVGEKYDTWTHVDKNYANTDKISDFIFLWNYLQHICFYLRVCFCLVCYSRIFHLITDLMTWNGRCRQLKCVYLKGS